MRAKAQLRSTCNSHGLNRQSVNRVDETAVPFNRLHGCACRLTITVGTFAGCFVLWFQFGTGHSNCTYFCLTLYLTPWYLFHQSSDSQTIPHDCKVSIANGSLLPSNRNSRGILLLPVSCGLPR